ISPQWVVTSFSAINIPNVKDTSFRVQAGVIDHTNTTEQYEQFIPIQDLQYIAGFDATQHFNDIALVHLSKPLRFNDYVQPVCLPSSDDIAV
ncbi:hypothetical protein PFISCL1PPCAC_7433, partial [Pristionchus fissidentatus]